METIRGYSQENIGCSAIYFRLRVRALCLPVWSARDLVVGAGWGWVAGLAAALSRGEHAKISIGGYFAIASCTKRGILWVIVPWLQEAP
jgi:hypothetical protein